MNQNSKNNQFSRFLWQSLCLNLLLLLAVALFSCEAPKKSNSIEIGAKQIDIKELIGKHRSETVFLSFWKNMNQDDFDSVKKYETENGNLVDGTFELLFENGTRAKFTISSEEKAVVLYFHEKQSVATHAIDGLMAAPTVKAFSYDYVENKLISLFESKHKKLYENVEEHRCIDSESLEAEWARALKTYCPMHIREAEYLSDSGENEVVISLHSEYSYWDCDFDIRKAKPGTTDYYWHENRDESTAVISEARITLTFELRNDYSARKDQEERQRIDKWNLEEKLKQDNDEKIQRNNNLL